MRIRATVVRAALLTSAVLAAGCSQEFPAEIAGARGALDEFSQCVLHDLDGYADVFTGDLYVTSVTLPPFEGRWSNEGASMLYFDAEATTYEVGVTNVRAQLGPLIPHRPDCESGCFTPYRPLYLEGMRFAPARVCLSASEASCIEFGGGSVDRMYVWCSSSEELAY